MARAVGASTVFGLASKAAPAHRAAIRDHFRELLRVERLCAVRECLVGVVMNFD